MTFPETAFSDPSQARLLHYQDGAWTDVTTDVDPITRRVCGNVTHFSPFAVATRVATFLRYEQPVDVGVINLAKAGSAIPVKFSLNGFHGYNIFAAGSPATSVANCVNGLASDAIETTTAAMAGSLTYDPVTDLYTYVWKTAKNWSGCRSLNLNLTVGGPAPVLQFRFR